MGSGKEAPAMLPNTVVMPRMWMRELDTRMPHWRGIMI